jgi:hypothetical protein
MSVGLHPHLPTDLRDPYREPSALIVERIGNMKTVAVLFGIFSVMVGVPSKVHADPVRIIIDGFFGSGGDDTGFWALGSDFSLQTGALPRGMDPVVSCNPCTPGSQLNLSSAVTIANWGAGSATLDGQTWINVYYGGTLSFTADSVVVADVPPQPAGLEETVVQIAFAPFTFTGTLIGFADPSLTGTPLFSVQLAGGGSSPLGGMAGFGNLGTGVFVDYVDYLFDETAPTPEPASLLLFGSGAALVAARCRKRRQQEVC